MYLKIRRDTKRQETRFEFWIGDRLFSWLIYPDLEEYSHILERWVEDCKRRYKKAEVIEIGGEDV